MPLRLGRGRAAPGETCEVAGLGGTPRPERPLRTAAREAAQRAGCGCPSAAKGCVRVRGPRVRLVVSVQTLLPPASPEASGAKAPAVGQDPRPRGRAQWGSAAERAPPAGELLSGSGETWGWIGGVRFHFLSSPPQAKGLCGGRRLLGERLQVWVSARSWLGGASRRLAWKGECECRC